MLKRSEVTETCCFWKNPDRKLCLPFGNLMLSHVASMSGSKGSTDKQIKHFKQQKRHNITLYLMTLKLEIILKHQSAVLVWINFWTFRYLQWSRRPALPSAAIPPQFPDPGWNTVQMAALPAVDPTRVNSPLDRWNSGSAPVWKPDSFSFSRLKARTSGKFKLITTHFRLHTYKIKSRRSSSLERDKIICF